jgi:hypothetical protein
LLHRRHPNPRTTGALIHEAASSTTSSTIAPTAVDLDELALGGVNPLVLSLVCDEADPELAMLERAIVARPLTP